MTSNQTSAQEIGSWMRQKANTLAPAAREDPGLARGGATVKTHQSPPLATPQKRACLRHSRKASNQRTALAICCRVQQKPSAPTPARREAPELAHGGVQNSARASSVEVRWRPVPSALKRLFAGHEGGLVRSHDRGCASQIGPQHCNSGNSARRRTVVGSTEGGEAEVRALAAEGEGPNEG